MPALGKFLKSPSEIKRYSIEYVDWLDVGEYISAVNVVVLPATDTPLLYDVEVPSTNDTNASFFVASGVAGKNYKLIVRITTTTGQVKEDVVMIEVRAL